jgi:hypothetical protein
MTAVDIIANTGFEIDVSNAVEANPPTEEELNALSAIEGGVCQ